MSESLALSERDEAAAGAVPQSPARAERRLQWIYGAVGLSALLSFASFHPIDLGLLAYVALVPILALAAIETRRVAIAASYSATFLYHLVGLSWIAMVTAPGWLLTCGIEGLYGVALVCLPLWIRRRTGLPLVLTLAPIGVALELIRGNFPFIAFPWLFWGHTQHARSLLIQVADVTSVYGLSFLVLTVNAALADVWLLLRARWRVEEDLSPADHRRLRWILAAPALVLVLFVGYGLLRRPHVRAAMADDPGPRVLVVQVDFPQTLKDAGGEGPFHLADRHLSLTHTALLRNRDEPLDAIIWSETMWQWPIPDARSPEALAEWDEFFRGWHPEYVVALRQRTRQLLALPDRAGAPLFVGAVDRGFGSGGQHNSYYALAPDPPREARVAHRYDKINLVPVSEYIPFRDSSALGWLHRAIQKLVPPGFTSFDRGTSQPLMEAGDYLLAANICFEISFPELLRHATKAGASAHVCPANDAWFVHGPVGHARPTAEIELAKAHTVFRAIENRRPVIRSVNRGISLIAAPDGEIVAQVEKRDRAGEVQTVGIEGDLLANAPTTDLLSFYVRFGNVFPALCLLASLLLLAFARKGAPLLPPTEGIPSRGPDELAGGGEEPQRPGGAPPAL